MGDVVMPLPHWPMGRRHRRLIDRAQAVAARQDAEHRAVRQMVDGLCLRASEQRAENNFSARLSEAYGARRGRS